MFSIDSLEKQILIDVIELCNLVSDVVPRVGDQRLSRLDSLPDNDASVEPQALEEDQSALIPDVDPDQLRLDEDGKSMDSEFVPELLQRGRLDGLSICMVVSGRIMLNLHGV